MNTVQLMQALLAYYAAYYVLFSVQVYGSLRAETKVRDMLAGGFTQRMLWLLLQPLLGPIALLTIVLVGPAKGQATEVPAKPTQPPTKPAYRGELP